jgi:hypothetical protein
MKLTLRQKLTMLRLGLKKTDLVERDGIAYHKWTDVPFPQTYPPPEKGRSRSERGSFIGNMTKDGPWEHYHSNGQLQSKGTYEDGIPIGPWVSYHDNGQLRGKSSSDGSSVRYWKNGQLQSKGKGNDCGMDGPWVSFHPDGTVDKENTGTFKNGVKVSD